MAPSGMSPIAIELVRVGEHHKVALQRGREHLQALLRVTLPKIWPQFPEAFAPSNVWPSVDQKWSGYFFISTSERALVGNGGFFGPPNEDGEVEIGYEIAPEFQNRGLATAAAAAMQRLAFSHEEVRAIVAHTLAENNASNSVLKKLGMRFVSERPDPEVGAVWAWRLDR